MVPFPVSVPMAGATQVQAVGANTLGRDSKGGGQGLDERVSTGGNAAK